MRTVSTRINWQGHLHLACREGAAERKPLFVDFWKPGCGGSQKMSMETYCNEDVVRLLNNDFVPTRLHIGEHPADARRYKVFWTPSLLCLEPDGTVHQRTEGWVPSGEMAAMLQLWLARYRLSHQAFDEASELLDRVLNRWPRTPWSAEALYLKGVADYRRTGERDDLARSWARLRGEQPFSPWTSRALSVLEA